MVSDNELTKRFEEVADVLVNASTSFDVWAELQNGAKRDQYEPVVSDYFDFFESVVVAHLIAFTTLLYQAMETRQDTFNFPTLLAAISKHHGNSKELDEIEKSINSLKPIWIKLSRVRNEMFGHRSSKAKSVNLFKQIRLLPGEIETLINGLKLNLQKLAKLCNVHLGGVLNVSARADTAALMESLSCQP